MIHGGWMILVSDASVAVKWAVEEEDSEKAIQLLNGEHELHVPRMLAAELANALRSKVLSGVLAPHLVAGMLESALTDLLHWANDEGLAADALRIAIALNHPVYDCVYLALAYRIDGTLITADQRFVNLLADTEHGNRVTLLRDFGPAERIIPA